MLKYHSLRYKQATLKPKTLTTITLSSVNATDRWLENACLTVTANERREIVRKRMEEENLFEKELLMKVFGTDDIELIMNE